MGLSASQSRMLTLTARLSDLELKAQDIQQKKIRLAEKSTEASKKYMDALDAQTLKFNYYSTGSVDATVRSITNSGLYRVADAYGHSFVYLGAEDIAQKDSNGRPIYTDSSTGRACKEGWYVLDTDGTYHESTVDEQYMTDSTWLYDQLKLANLFIQKHDLNEDKWNDYSYISSSLFTEVDDSTSLAQAEAEYEYSLSLIQDKDKRFDLDLDNINTEHEAVKTEVDSVKKVVEENIGKTFKVFS